MLWRKIESRVIEMGCWGIRDKVQNCKQDSPYTCQCERCRKQGGERVSQVNTEGRVFQAKGMANAKALR